VRILFCGDCFPASRSLLKERLPSGQAEIIVCDGINLRKALASCDVVIPMMTILDEALLEAGTFRLVQQWGSGLEGVDLDAARVRGIWVANVPASGNNADSVAEHALWLTLSLLRHSPIAQANIRSGILGAPMGRMVAGRTVCLWGLGATALALARRLRALNAKILGLTRDPKAPKVATFGLDRCYGMKEREACLRETEILILCVRLSAATRGLVDSTFLAMLREAAYLINTSRGALIDYDSLYSAVAGGRLAGVGLDVFWQEPISPDDPLLQLPNVIATPHIAGVTEESYGQIADAVAANIRCLGRGLPILNRVI